MKHIYRLCLGCVCLGVFLTNGAIYVMNHPYVHPLAGVVSMASWILMWLFLADSSHRKLTEQEKFRGAFTMGVAACYLLYHIFVGALVPKDLMILVAGIFVWFFSGAVNIGLWWAEACPAD